MALSLRPATFLFLLAVLQSGLSSTPTSGDERKVGEEYYGVRIGKFSTNFHEVRGEVYAVDDKTIFIKNFTYDGKGPDTFFWAGSSIRPDTSGFIIPNEKGSIDPLDAYTNQDVLLRLPAGKHVQNLRWLAVWCRQFTANFGSLIFPRGLKAPERVEIGSLSTTGHRVSSGPILILDAQTFFIPDFTFDGQDKGAYWWVSGGQELNAEGVRLQDENGRDSPLRQYSGEAVVIALPEGHAIYDYKWFGLWSTDEKKSLGHVQIPAHISVPPSSRMLGTVPESQLNCEVLHNDLGFELRWVMDGEHVVMQLVGKIKDDEYMAFGLSKDDTVSEMVNADAVVAWIDKDGDGHAVDYFLGAKQECNGNEGACPDTAHEGGENNAVLMNAALVNGYKMVSFRRPLAAVDSRLDQRIFPVGHQAVMWAIGPVKQNGEIGYHHLRTKGNLLIEFGRTPRWNCPAPGDEDVEVAASEDHETISSAPLIAQTSIICPADHTFRAQLGPDPAQIQKQKGQSTGRRTWYINGLPQPELTVMRGETYTFLVEGGQRRGDAGLYHPLYLTDSSTGGIPNTETLYGGVSPGPDGQLVATAAGRLCEWSTYSTDSELPETLSYVSGKQRTLELSCEPGAASILQWTPSEDTPDVLYYHSFTQPGMGAKIHVVDSCEETAPHPYLETLGDPGKEGTPEKQSDAGGEREIEGAAAYDPQNVPPADPQIIQERIISSVHRPPPQDTFGAPLQVGPPLDPVPGVEGFQQTRPEGPFEPAGQVYDQRIPLPPPYRIRPDTQFVPPLGFEQDGPRPELQFVPPPGPIPEVSRPPFLQQSDVHYERGFLPLRLPGTNSELNRIPDPTAPPPGSLRPFPFDANQSIPFHGTFKPGKLDFSGFNVSSYGPVTVAPQFLRVQTAPRPHLIQQPLSPARPPQLYPRPPPAMGLLPRPLPPHVNPESIVPQGSKRFVFVKLPHQQGSGGYPLPRPIEEDLEAQSSQRVYVAVQSPERPIQKQFPQRGPGKVQPKIAPPLQGQRWPVTGKFPTKPLEQRLPIQQAPNQGHPIPQSDGPVNPGHLRPRPLIVPRPPISGDASRPLPYGSRLRVPIQGGNTRFGHQGAPPPGMLVPIEQPPQSDSFPRPVGGHPVNDPQSPRPVREPLMEEDPNKKKDGNEDKKRVDEEEPQTVESSPPHLQKEQVIFPHSPITSEASQTTQPHPQQERVTDPEHLVLPQAEAQAPPPDNDTDYSIFSHVFSLITEDGGTSNIAVPRSLP